MFCTHHNVTQAFITLTWPCIHLTCRFHPLFHSLRLVTLYVQVNELCRKWKIDCATINISMHKLHIFLFTFIFEIITRSNYIWITYIFIEQTFLIILYRSNSTWTHNMEMLNILHEFFLCNLFIFSLKALKIRRWFMYYIISQRNWFFTSIHLTGLSRAKFARIFNFFLSNRSNRYVSIDNKI